MKGLCQVGGMGSGYWIRLGLGLLRGCGVLVSLLELVVTADD